MIMTENRYVAIVEDDEDDRDFITMALNNSSPQMMIQTFRNGTEFLRFVQTAQQLPGLIITDIRMPLVSGFDVIAEIKSASKTKDIAIVVLSTSGSEADKTRARELGAADYFIKPYSVEEYSAITGNIVERLNAGTLKFSHEFRQIKAFIKRSFTLCFPWRPLPVKV